MKTKHKNCFSVRRLLTLGLVVFGFVSSTPAQSVFQASLSTPPGAGLARLHLGQFYFRVEANEVDFVAVLSSFGSLSGNFNPMLTLPGQSIGFSLGVGERNWFHGSHTIANNNPFLPARPLLPAGYDEDGNPYYVDTANITIADVYTGHFTLPDGFEDGLLAGLGRMELNAGASGAIQVAAVPEPTALSLALLAGLGGFGYSRFQRGSDRLAKYNQLLRIEQLLGKIAVYAGLTALKKSK